MSKTWTVLYKDEVGAHLTARDSDFPWLIGTITPGPAYDSLSAALLEGDRLLDQDEASPAYDSFYEHFQQDAKLLTPEGQPVAEFLLHFEGDTAHWRWVGSDDAE